jgi:hypothetical protein
MDKAFLEEQIGIITAELAAAEQRAAVSRAWLERAVADYETAEGTAQHLAGLILGLKDELGFTKEKHEL